MLLVLLLLAWCSGLPSANAAAKVSGRPNLLFLMADQDVLDDFVQPSEPQRASSDQRQETGGSTKLLGRAPRPRLERGRGSASADDSQSREVGSQNQYTVEQDDAEARHLLGPLLDDLSDGGPSTNRRGYVTET